MLPLREREAILVRMALAARDAAALIRQIYLAPAATAALEVEWKTPGDPVTRADREANEHIVTALSKDFPGVPIVAEESEASSYQGHTSAALAFFVDPLDGTREFVARSGEFAVMIGLADQGRPVLGVVTRPQPFITFAGGPELGVYSEDHETGARRALTISSTRSLDAARVVISRSHRSPSIDAALSRLAARELVPYGSAGLKALQVVTGEADLYVQPKNAGYRWDSAAPEALVLGAGGVLTDALGSPIDYHANDLMNRTGVVAGSPALHGEAVRRLDLARFPLEGP
jgi:3'(2'), 5'-bisphosphate nucleotidase